MVILFRGWAFKIQGKPELWFFRYDKNEFSLCLVKFLPRLVGPIGGELGRVTLDLMLGLMRDHFNLFLVNFLIASRVHLRVKN